VTQTKGTTTGQAYSEAEVPRHDTNVHVHVHDGGTGKGQPGADGRGGGLLGGGARARETDARQGDPGQRAVREDDNASDREVRDAEGKRGMRPSEQAKASGWPGGSGTGRGGTAEGRRSGGWLSGGGNGAGGSPGAKGKKPEIDVVKTSTSFSAQHESEAKTQSWTKTEETSHTRSSSQSRTDGTSVGDEITYELVYDHKVEPETLMALPEDQMLAPQIVAGADAARSLPGNRVTAESRIVALVIDPSIVGSDTAAPVRPDEIPAYEPPAPAVSSHVPDYEQVPRRALNHG
jgi:hypothetical protein